MKNNISKKDRSMRIIRLAARIIGTLAIMFFLAFVVGEIIFNTEPVTLEGIMVASFIVLLTMGVFIAWLKEGIGGIMLIITAVAYAIFIYFSAGRNKILAALLISSPFLISGILFCIYNNKKLK